jgi:hypothetical protein
VLQAVLVVAAEDLELKILPTEMLHKQDKLIAVAAVVVAKIMVQIMAALVLKIKCTVLDLAEHTAKVLTVGQVLLLFDINQK